MKVKRNQKFSSKQTGVIIRVVGIVEKSFLNEKRDKIKVVTIDEKGKSIAPTARVIQSDSIRRRYFEVSK